MAIYYIDGDNGDDLNNGLSSETAWKTIRKAASTLQAGDTVYIKPTIYRISAQINQANSGTESNPIQYIGDVKGEIWGIKKYPRITNRKAEDETTYYTYLDVLFYLGEKFYIYFKGLMFDFREDCNDSNNSIFRTEISRIYIEDCLILLDCNGKLNILSLYSTESEDNYFYIDRSIIMSIGDGYSVIIYSDSLIPFVECRITNSFIYGYFYCGFYGYFGFDNLYVINNTILTSRPFNFFESYENTDTNSTFKNNLLLSNFNIYYNFKVTVENNYTLSKLNSDSSLKNCLFIPNIKDIFKDTDKYFLFWNASDKGNTSSTSIDYFGNPRPLGLGPDVGATEFNPGGVKESNIKKSGNYSIKLEKAAYQDFKIYVLSGTHTVSVYTKWSGYSGPNKPQLIIFQDKYCGINSDQVATATGDGSDWEQLSINLNLTKDAEIVVRIYSPDTGENAVTYFDELSIS